MEKEKKPRKPKAKEEATAWERLPKTISGKKTRIIFYVPNEWITRMKRAGELLKNIGAMEQGKGIEKNYPGEFCKFCVGSTLGGIEKLIDDNEQRNK